MLRTPIPTDRWGTTSGPLELCDFGLGLRMLSACTLLLGLPWVGSEVVLDWFGLALDWFGGLWRHP